MKNKSDMAIALEKLHDALSPEPNKKIIRVIIQKDGLTAKEVNTMKEPKKRNFRGTGMFEKKMAEYQEAQRNLRTFDIESVENINGEVGSVKSYQLQHIAGTEETAEILENGKLKLLYTN